MMGSNPFPRPLLAAATTTAWLLAANAWADRVITLEGDSIEGRILGIDANGKVQLENTDVPWLLEELRALQPIAPADTIRQGGQEIVLTNGSRLYGRDLRIEDETIAWESAILGAMSVPIDYVWALRLQPAEPDSRFEAATATLSELERDVFFVTGTGTAEMQEATGLVETMSSSEITFADEKGELHRLPALQVHGVVLASPLMTLDELPGVPCTVFLRDGSRCVAAVQGLQAGELTIQLVDDLFWKLPWSEVRRINVKSGRLTYLSDMEPVNVMQEAIYAFPRTWKRDRNVRGGPLQVREERFEKGLGTAGGTRLFYTNDEDYDLFTASIGLDASRLGLGECEFVVYGDGRELFRRRMHGRDQAAFIKVPVSGVAEITLYVDPGIDALDLADDADWGDACLIQLR